MLFVFSVSSAACSSAAIWMLAGSAGLLLITAAIGLLIIVYLVCHANRDQPIASECVHHFIVVKPDAL